MHYSYGLLASRPNFEPFFMQETATQFEQLSRNLPTYCMTL